MGANIKIQAGQAATVIGSGARPPAPIVAAGQIQGWTEQQLVISGNTQIKDSPFAAGGGECLYDTGSLFCFAGAQAPDASNVLMVLWNFQTAPSAGDTGDGWLNAPPAAGVLANGPISWEIAAIF